MLPTNVPPAAAATITCLLIGSTLLFLRHKTQSNKTSSQKKERMAKESFRVRKSNLLAVSGRGRKRTNKRGNKHWHSKTYDDSCEQTSSWLGRIVSLFKQFISQFKDKSKPNASSMPPQLGRLPKISMEGYYDNVTVVGLDCEMVGGGKGGMISMLARCSVVTLNTTNNVKCTNLNDNLIILYDKYIIPKGRITDYRTQWSGISKETYEDGGHDVPIVTFYQCQKEITELFSSIDGKSVVVVGHALENDFDVLEIKHPDAFIRDTAFYRPYMRQVRRRLFPRKLSALSSEELGIEIQQEPQLIDQSSDATPNEYSPTVGHSSVEDAAAALRLYWHKHEDWERSLRYPLLMSNSTSNVVRWPPIQCVYLDCCNLPLGLRGVDFKALLTQSEESIHNDDGIISSKSVRLVSRQSSKSNNTSLITTTDWIPYFRSALLPGAHPQIQSFVIMFDGAKFRDITKNQNLQKKNNGHHTKRFQLESPQNHGTIAIEITNDGDSADDILFHQCNNTEDAPLGRIISLDKAAELFSNPNPDQLDSYLVIRRKAGGSKSHKRLFDKLHLRRPNEGALCLSGLTTNLHKDSWRTIRELQRERNVEKVIECELRRRDELMHVVVTDDVYLTERLVGVGSVLVLSYRQMENMFG